MSTNAVPTKATSVARVDMKVEVVVIPVSDVDRTTQFYLRLGWRQDVTHRARASCSLLRTARRVPFNSARISRRPRLVQPKSYLIVSDIEDARNKLVAAGIEVSGLFHIGPNGPLSGPDPEHGTYRSLASFSDPDGNVWLLQEITTRLPGRIDTAATSFGSASDLASALRRAAAAHGKHEKRIGEADPNRPDWYAEYMVAEQAGTGLPT